MISLMKPQTLAYATPFKAVLVASDGSEEQILPTPEKEPEIYGSTHMSEAELDLLFLREIRQLKDTIALLEKIFQRSRSVQHEV